MAELHLRLRDLDDEQVWLPSPPGAPVAVESLPGELPAEYRAFLSTANGWSGFYKGIDLLPASELERPGDSGLIIGHAREADDLFVLSKSGSVTWLGGGEVVDEFETFTAFFDGIVAQTREEERALEARRA